MNSFEEPEALLKRGGLLQIGAHVVEMVPDVGDILQVPSQAAVLMGTSEGPFLQHNFLPGNVKIA